jgi:hypothetical protein
MWRLYGVMIELFIAVINKLSQPFKELTVRPGLKRVHVTWILNYIATEGRFVSF